MNKLKNKIARTLIVATLAICTVFVLGANTYAVYDTNSILKRSLVRALVQCYQKGAVTDGFGAIGEFQGASSLVASKGGNVGPFAIPSGMKFSSYVKESVNCKQVIEGGSGTSSSIKSAFDITGHPVPASGSDSSAGSFLTQYAGYKFVANASPENGKCVYGLYKKYTYNDQISSSRGTPSKEEDIITNPLCADKIENGKITGTVTMINNAGKSGYGLGFTGFGGAMYVDKTAKAVKIALTKRNEYQGVQYTYETIPYNNVSWESFKSKIDDAFAKNKIFNYTHYTPGAYNNPQWMDTRVIYTKIKETPNDIGSYKLDDTDGKRTAAALLGIDKGKVDSALQITAQEQVHLYMYYLTDIYQGVVDCSEMDQSAALANGYKGPIKWFKTGETSVTENCFVTSYRARGENGGNVNGLSTNSGGVFTEPHNMTFSQLIEYFKSLKITELDDPSGSSVTDGDSDSSERAPDCHTNAGAMGWLLCPIIDVSSAMVEKTYSGLIEPYLSIDAVLFDTNSEGGAAVRSIWGVFQGFANLAFVIIFLFVIFSQLTGVGIDNYGIKKILPKLIIGAVLINVSYIICQLSVDVSNILGRAVKGLFENMAGTIGDSLSRVTVNLNPSMAPPVSNKFDSGILMIVGIASVLGIGAFHAAGPAIIIPALVALVSIVIGVLFLFIMLSLRQAIAVILVVVSPLAFAAYILPNTKKSIFDKWYEAFKGMLIAYPICSALVYGGDFVSKILIIAETGNGERPLSSLGMTLSAAAVSIAPIFFIPSMIRKGMNSIGGLGDKLDSIRGNMNRTARAHANDRLEHSWLTDYRNRRREGREAENNERIANNARNELNGTRTRDRLVRFITNGQYGNGLQDRVNRRGIANLTAAERAHYNSTVRTAASDDAERLKLYEDSFSTMSEKQVHGQMEAMINSGRPDMNLAIAGINRIAQINTGHAIDEVATLSTMAGFGDNARDINRLSSSLAQLPGNPVLNVYAKDLNHRPRSLDAFRADQSDYGMKARIQALGNNALDDANRDYLEYAALHPDIAQMHPDAQANSLYAQGFGGNMGTRVIDFAVSRGIPNDPQNNYGIQSMSTSQVLGMNADLLHAMDSMLHKHGTNIQTVLGRQIAEAQTPQNAQMLANASGRTRDALGIPRQNTTP